MIESYNIIHGLYTLWLFVFLHYRNTLIYLLYKNRRTLNVGLSQTCCLRLGRNVILTVLPIIQYSLSVVIHLCQVAMCGLADLILLLHVELCLCFIHVLLSLRHSSSLFRCISLGLSHVRLHYALQRVCPSIYSSVAQIYRITQMHKDRFRLKVAVV